MIFINHTMYLGQRKMLATLITLVA